MSPVFRHGRLRLYLLKLLDEAPRHGYEVIRLLQDRFLGVYAPSPGTIYPRLARLEEEGLVTHDEVDGKKVYRITDKGREEIQSRLDDLAELEEEITESVRDIAREVTQDVRDTVRNLREELTWAARDVRRDGREQAREQARERARQTRDEVRESATQARDETRSDRVPGGYEGTPGDAAGPWAAAAQAPEEAGRADEAGGAWGGAWGARERASGPRRDRRGGARKDWADWAAFQDWQSWAGWRERPGRHGWPGFGGFPGSAPPGSAPPGPGEPGSGPPWPPGPWNRARRGGSARPDAGLFRDLERLAVEFARELRTAAWHTESVGENALSDLRAILEDTLSKVRDEVFGGTAAAAEPGRQAAGPGGSAGTAGTGDIDADETGKAGEDSEADGSEADGRGTRG